MTNHWEMPSPLPFQHLLIHASDAASGRGYIIVLLAESASHPVIDYDAGLIGQQGVTRATHWLFQKAERVEPVQKFRSVGPTHFNTAKCGSTQRSTDLCGYLCNLFFERNVHTKYNA